MIHYKRAVGLLLFATVTLLLHPEGRAQAQTKQPEEFPPFKIAGNLYYVGPRSTAEYLISTPQGLILINADWARNVPLIRASVEKLGFKFSDIKILLISHAHIDHAEGAAAIKAQTGAQYMVMEQDVDVVESGGKTDFNHGIGLPEEQLFPAAKVDRVLHDGDTVSLGGTELTAHLTPGHTKGCTTWTMKVQDGGKTYNVVIVGSAAVGPKVDMLHNPRYPNQVQDYELMFRVLKTLPADIFLGAHGNYFNMEKKYAQLQQNAATNPFIDPAGYKEYVANSEKEFLSVVAKQKAGQLPVAGQRAKQ
jgi:metallo-beta-lactamase class B